jgi:hypothetical protein
MTRPLTDVLLIAHIVVAGIAYVALATTGAFGRRLRRSRDPFASAAIRRYFRPGSNLAARAIYLVPVLGLAVVGAGDRSDFSRPFPWIGLAIWVVSVGIASGSCWPAEAEAQQLLAAPPGDDARARLRERGRVIEVGAAAITGCFLAALVVMVAQP